jgi:hypothetical protein
VNTFELMRESSDWEGALELGSEMTDTVVSLEIFQPFETRRIRHILGTAHKVLASGRGVETAIVHFQKAIDLGKEVGDQRGIKESMLCLAECYVKMNRVEQAMDLYKSQWC